MSRRKIIQFKRIPQIGTCKLVTNVIRGKGVLAIQLSVMRFNYTPAHFMQYIVYRKAYIEHNNRLNIKYTDLLIVLKTSK